MLKKILAKSVYVMTIGLMLFTAGCDGADLPQTPQEEPTTVATAVGQEDILSVSNTGEMINQPKYAPSFTLTEPWQVTLIITIHWNEGQGAEPGQISLKDENGKVYGPWQAVGKVFKDVGNVRWIVEPNQTLPPGKYKVIDSDSVTWANNQESEFVGFTRVAGVHGGNLANVPAGDQPVAPAGDQPVLPLKMVAETIVNADGNAVQDAAGVAATVPQGTVTDGGSLKLVASQPAADFDQALQQNGLKRMSDIYKLVVNGEGDSLPDAVISFPSAAPDDRVAKLVEGNGLILADDEEVDGQRVVHAFIGLTGDKAPQYFLLGSVEAADTAPRDAMVKNVGTESDLGKASAHLADLISEDAWPASVFEDCSIDWKGIKADNSGATNVTVRDMSCRRDKTYHNMGLSGAELYYNVSIKVVKVLKSPLYSPLLGVINFGWKDVVSDVTDPKTEQTIEHELFHNVEHHTYNMRVITEMVGEMTWWLEMSAETATFLLNPSNPQVELNFYGQVSNGGAGTKLTFQEPPFDWYMRDEDSRYIQALQFFMMMSRKTTEGDFTCLPDQKGFVDAINRGVDGIAEGNNRKIYRDGNWYFAQYLLNQPPGNMCRDMETG
ncbi:MAG TPA: hypothetical protein VF338_09050, partial [Leptolinea sp.]